MTSENVTEAESVQLSEAAPSKSVDDRLVDELLGRAQALGLQLTGEGGLLQQLSKRLLEVDGAPVRDDRVEVAAEVQSAREDSVDDSEEKVGCVEDPGQRRVGRRRDRPVLCRRAGRGSRRLRRCW